MSKETFVPIFQVWIDDTHAIIGFSYPPIGGGPEDYSGDGTADSPLVDPEEHKDIQIAERCWAITAKVSKEKARKDFEQGGPFSWRDYTAANFVACKIPGAKVVLKK